MTVGQRIWGWCRRLGRSLPLLGPLAYCTAKNHLDSLKEFAVTVLFATATFWVTAVFLRAFVANRGASYLDLLQQTVDSGQLFIFAVGMLGPILIAAADDPANNKKFPGRLSHFSLLFLLGALASGFYALQLSAKSGVGLGLDTSFLFSTSVAIALAVLILRYLTMVYRKSTVNFDPETQMKDPVSDFAKRFAERHEGQS
jgi:hypothetical protein